MLFHIDYNKFQSEKYHVQVVMILARVIFSMASSLRFGFKKDMQAV